MRTVITICLLCLNASATSLVIIVKNSKIVVAADSKLSTQTLAGARASTDLRQCKIHKLSGFYWSFVGMNSTPQFNLEQTVAEADSIEGTLETKVRRFEALAASRLPGVMFPSEQLTVMFYKITWGTPELFVSTFVGAVNGKFTMPPGLQFRCSPCGDTAMPFYFGVMKPVHLAIAENPKLLQLSPEILAPRLVKIAMKESPTLVGPPIAQIEITAKGERWISKGSCSF